MSNGVITLEDIKKAIYKVRFRSLFPDLSSQFEKAQKKMGCDKCTIPLFKELVQRKDQLQEYFGDVEFDIQIPMTREDAGDIPNVFVISDCHVDELDARLMSLPLGGGPLNISVGRYEDRVTVVVQEL